MARKNQDHGTTAVSRAVWLVPLLVAVVTFLAFLPALEAGFVTWDDDKNFTDNLDYRGLGLDQLRWMWTTFHLGHYVPLSWMTLGLDYKLWGMNPTGYHLTNLLLHTTNAVLVYFLAQRLFVLAAPANASTKADPRYVAVAAAFVALLFSLHPLRVESVAWITERRDVLSFLFYLASTLSYLRAWDRAERRKRWYVLSFALFVCALLSKGTSVTLPAVLLILNVYPLRRIGPGSWWTESARRVYLELAPFVLLAAATVGLTLLALQDLPQLNLVQKAAVSAYSLAFYLWKTLAPTGLAPLYAMPATVDPFATRYVLSVALLIAISAGAWLARNRWPGATAAWLAFLATVAPMLGLVQNGPQIAADRYTYFAAPFVAMLAGGMLLSVRGSRRGVAMGAAGLALVVLGALTWRQTGIWHDSKRLWTQVLHVEPQSAIGHNNMGNLLFLERRFNDAVTYYTRAIAIAPEYGEAHNNLGVAYSWQGRWTDAIAQYERAIRVFPTNDKAHDNWGIALDAVGKPTEAIGHFRTALAINPQNADAVVNWGNALLKLGKVDEAILMYKDALRREPTNAEAHVNWGVALARAGKLAEAIEQFQRALYLKPESPEAKSYLEQATRSLRPAK